MTQTHLLCFFLTPALLADRPLVLRLCLPRVLPSSGRKIVIKISTLLNETAWAFPHLGIGLRSSARGRRRFNEESCPGSVQGSVQVVHQIGSTSFLSHLNHLSLYVFRQGPRWQPRQDCLQLRGRRHGDFLLWHGRNDPRHQGQLRQVQHRHLQQARIHRLVRKLPRIKDH
jgi:hypothetical protein